MIPFWKKTGKHSKPQSAQKRRQNAKPAVPRTAQQSIPMQRMFEDGTCRVKPNYYTRTIQYQDINYQLAQQEDKTAIFEELNLKCQKKDSVFHFQYWRYTSPKHYFSVPVALVSFSSLFGQPLSAFLKQSHPHSASSSPQ